VSEPAVRKKWLLRVLRLTVLGLVLWGVSSSLYRGWQQLRHPQQPQQRVTIQPGWLVLAAVFYGVGMLPFGIFWLRSLSALGQRPGLLETMRAYYIGHLGKYVPGKAMVVVLRAGLLRSQRTNATVAAATVFLETLTMMAVGAFLAACVLLLMFREQGMLALLAVGLMIASGLPTVPVVFRKLTGWVLKRRTASEEVPLERITGGLIASGWGLAIVAWCLLGLSLWATLESVSAAVSLSSDFPIILAAVTLAMVAGFLSLLPGGAGVRDLILFELMVKPFGAGYALAASVLLRLVWLVSELLISSILYLMGRPASAGRIADGATQAEDPTRAA